MKKVILAALLLTFSSGLYSEDLVTEKIRFGRMGGSIMNAGYIKHFTDKYPTLLDEEFRKEVRLEIPPAEIFIKDPDPFSERVLDPKLERCISNNRKELKLEAARYVRTFEMHGAEFTSIEGAKLQIDIGRFELIITNTKENINKTKELFGEFSKYWSKHRYDENPISTSRKLGDPFAHTNK